MRESPPARIFAHALTRWIPVSLLAAPLLVVATEGAASVEQDRQQAAARLVHGGAQAAPQTGAQVVGSLGIVAGPVRVAGLAQTLL